MKRFLKKFVPIPLYHVVELHDRIKDGCTQALSDATDKNIWTEYTAGEKVILIRKKFL